MPTCVPPEPDETEPPVPELEVPAEPVVPPVPEAAVHMEVSNLHMALHWRMPPLMAPKVAVAQVALAGTIMSQSSPVSTTPLPQVAPPLLLSEPHAPSVPAATKERATTTMGNLSFMTHILQGAEKRIAVRSFR